MSSGTLNSSIPFTSTTPIPTYDVRFLVDAVIIIMRPDAIAGDTVDSYRCLRVNWATSSTLPLSHASLSVSVLTAIIQVDLDLDNSRQEPEAISATWVSRYQNVSILDFTGAKGDDGGEW